MRDTLLLTDLPDEAEAHAQMLAGVASSRAGAMKVAVALDAILFAVDAHQHGSEVAPRAPFDSRLKELRRRHAAIRSPPLGGAEALPRSNDSAMRAVTLADRSTASGHCSALPACSAEREHCSVCRGQIVVERCRSQLVPGAPLAKQVYVCICA